MDSCGLSLSLFMYVYMVLVVGNSSILFSRYGLEEDGQYLCNRCNATRCRYVMGYWLILGLYMRAHHNIVSGEIEFCVRALSVCPPEMEFAAHQRICYTLLLFVWFRDVDAKYIMYVYTLKRYELRFGLKMKWIYWEYSDAMYMREWTDINARTTNWFKCLNYSVLYTV